MAVLEDKVLSLNDLIKFQDMDLKNITFEIVDATSNNSENDQTNLLAFKGQNTQNFVQIKKKEYIKQGQTRIMLQFINVSKDIMYEQVHAENEFLAITNATVSHELRNPLQSISS